jgi:hypothetical protein
MGAGSPIEAESTLTRTFPQTAAFAAATALILLAAGCAPVTTLEGERLSMSSEAFRAYVESVFREQNEVATQLTFVLEDEGLTDTDYDALDAAEAALLSACEGLNEIATARRDRRDLGKLEAARAARRAPQCELAARAARATIASVGASGP